MIDVGLLLIAIAGIYILSKFFSRKASPTEYHTPEGETINYHTPEGRATPEYKFITTVTLFIMLIVFLIVVMWWALVMLPKGGL